MNGKRILFSAIVIAVIGAVLGFILAKMKSHFYSYRTIQSSYLQQTIGGATIGLLVGAALESVKELKKQQDREEKLQDYLHTYLSLRDMDHKFDE